MRTHNLFIFSLLALTSIARALAPEIVAAQKPNEDDIVRVNSDLVTLNITVTNARGEYVHGLRREDFKIYEDGRAQTINSFGVEETPFVAAILLDTSGSMEGRLTLARSAAIRFLDGLRIDDFAAIYRFDSDIEQVQEFSSSRDLPQIAYGLRAKGMTVLNDAVVRAATDLSARAEKRRAIIVLSDGADTHSRISQEKALNIALACGVTIYTVDLTPPDAPLQEKALMTSALRAFADKSGGRYIASGGGQALRVAFAGIAEELGNQYTVTYQPTNRARDGSWRTIDVKLTGSNNHARTRRGYRASKT